MSLSELSGVMPTFGDATRMIASTRRAKEVFPVTASSDVPICVTKNVEEPTNCLVSPKLAKSADNSESDTLLAMP
jgi:hypothetical protein